MAKEDQKHSKCWDYRVIEEYYEREDLTEFNIHEVYYNEKGEIIGYTSNKATPSGLSLSELKDDCNAYMMAFNKPVLYKSELDKLWEGGSKKETRN
jgi:hypothetical protein